MVITKPQVHSRRFEATKHSVGFSYSQFLLSIIDPHF